MTYYEMYPVLLSKLIEHCEEARIVYERLSEGYEYGLSWWEFINAHEDEWMHIVQQYWTDLPLEKKIKYVMTELEYARSTVEHYEGWLALNLKEE